MFNGVVFWDSNWASSVELLFMPYANNKGADQPAHPCSLVSAFVVCCLDSIIPLLAIAEISRIWLVSVAEQAGLSLNRSATPKTGFHLTGLSWSNRCRMNDKEFLKETVCTDLFCPKLRNLSCNMTKPTKWLCTQRRLRSAWASAQSDQSLRCQHEESLGP